MRCLYPRQVGFQYDGKTIAWSPRKIDKQYSSFQLPCGKCIECRLQYAREWAVRCYHESLMHEDNCFITLTYSDEKLESPKLIYKHFQDFMKRLRDKYTVSEETRIGVFVTGEYGDEKKRPHWHAIIFNWRPPDCVYYRSNDRGDRIYTSKILDELWGYNDPDKRPNEIGDVTLDSAGYVARYAAKKLTHGKDQDHEYQPISKKSSKNAIGKKYLETYWRTVFNSGCVVVDGVTHTIPRYYEKWLKKHKPMEWEEYVTNYKARKIQQAEERSNAEKEAQAQRNIQRTTGNYGTRFERTRSESRLTILLQKFKKLMEKAKC